jgi:uncharacterized protein (TIGR03435 family)
VLKFHHETRERLECVLTVAKGGPKLTATKPIDPTVQAATQRNAANANSKDMVLTRPTKLRMH